MWQLSSVNLYWLFRVVHALRPASEKGRAVLLESKNMSVQSFLKSALKSSLTTLGAETITIGGVTFSAVIDETASSNELGRGANKDERTLIVKFAADAYSGTMKSGTAVTARSQSWQISAEPDAIRKGQVATTLTLVEPERRSE